ncbi:MAG: hypothetical protein ACSLFQ_10855 [Thermoanaerobaculia bacterium]
MLEEGRSLEEHVKIERGRSIVQLDIALCIGTSILTIMIYVMSLGPERLPTQIVRFLLTVVLCVFLYRGYSVARYLLIILLGVTLGLMGLALPSVFAAGKPGVTVGILLMGLGYAFIMVTLARSESVKAFLDTQEESRNPSVNIWPAN